MDQTSGVTPGDSPTGTEDVQAAPSPATQAVTTESAPVADRTPEQMFRELQRKYEQQARTQEQILQYLQAVQTPAAPQSAPQKTKDDLSDEDLWALAQQGDRNAFELYQSRIAERTYNQKQAVQNRTGIVDRQLTALFNRYPVLKDGSHPLTQAVNGAIRLYISQGYPDNKETRLVAATAAIADNPELVAELQGSPTAIREVNRRSSVQSQQSGVTGVTHRRDPAQPGKKALTAEEQRLAKNMQVKDPQGAKERFWKRQAEGQSSISPTVAAALGNVEDF